VEEQSRFEDLERETGLPAVRVKHVIVKCSSHKAAVDVQRRNAESTLKTASDTVKRDCNIAVDQTDCMESRHSREVAIDVQQLSPATASETVLSTKDRDSVEKSDTDQTASKNLNFIDTDSRSVDGDVMTSWRGSENVTHWDRTVTKPLEFCDDRRWVRSESQTPETSDDRCRVSRTSSLDQLRLRFQQQRRNTDSLRAELDRLRKQVVEKHRELDEEKACRRQLEEWTDYLESQLQTHITSRSLIEKQ